jgi:type III restriction enzyme
VTATPFVESTRGPVPFKNVVMDYPLARAMEDGFVKEPAAVTQRNFDAKAHTPRKSRRSSWKTACACTKPPRSSC